MANVVHRQDPRTSLQPFADREWGGFPVLELQGFAPSFGVKVTKDSLVIQAALPGMSESDLEFW